MIKINIIFCLITTAILILTYLFNLNEYAEILFLITLATVGISHGAIDHIIHLKINIDDKWKIKKFHFLYISTLIIIGIGWVISPIVSLIFFILVSAYHFGQSQLFYLKINKYLGYILYFMWGIFLLSLLLSTNQAGDILYDVINHIIWLDIAMLSGYILLVIFTFLWLFNMISIYNLFIELIVLFLLIHSNIEFGILFTFTLYFGIWHSLRTLMLQYDMLELRSLKSFIKYLLPYTLLVIGISIFVYFIMLYLNIDFSSEILLFGIISMLTMPHTIVMHYFYLKTNKKLDK